MVLRLLPLSTMAYTSPAVTADTSPGTMESAPADPYACLCVVGIKLLALLWLWLWLWLRLWWSWCGLFDLLWYGVVCCACCGVVWFVVFLWW